MHHKHVGRFGTAVIDIEQVFAQKHCSADQVQGQDHRFTDAERVFADCVQRRKHKAKNCFD